MPNVATQSEVLLVPKREAAHMLGISERTLHDLTRDGVVPHVRLGQRGVRYPVESLKSWIESQLTAAAE